MDSVPVPAPAPGPGYWCHHCDKRVSVVSTPDNPDLICSDCHFGFVESVSDSPDLSLPIDDTTLGSQFVHVLRLLAQVARDDHPSTSPPPPPSPPRNLASPFDLLRIQIDPDTSNQDNTSRNIHEEDDNNVNVNVHDRDDDDEDDDEDDDDVEESVRSVEIEGDSDDDDDDDDDDAEDDDVNETDDDIRRRQRRELLRLRLRDFATRAHSGGRNRLLDWAEILMGLENNSIELRFEAPDTDRYVGNPGDYVNEAEYETLLQNLAEAEGGRRGAPPASKVAVDGLKVVEIASEEECFGCAICKDGVNVGDVVKEMPCGHGYHGECIVPWLAARNSCPVCRFELPTDDAEYEEDKKKKGSDGGAAAGCGSDGGSSSVGV